MVNPLKALVVTTPLPSPPKTEFLKPKAPSSLASLERVKKLLEYAKKLALKIAG